MNLRYRIICERIKARARTHDWEPARVFSVPPATEEEIRATEEALGFPLPPMLRTLYMEVANGGDNITPGSGYTMIGAHAGRSPEEEARIELYAARGSLEKQVSRSRWRFPPETVEGLRQHRGAYVDCGEGEGWFEPPDGFVYLAHMGCEIGLYLDGPTGHLYLEDWGHVSFCAPSVEDWLERELDAPLSVQASYHPHTELESTVIADEKLSAVQLTQRLREENLTDDGPNQIEEAIRGFNRVNEELAKLGNRYPEAVVKSIARENQSALHSAHIKSIGRQVWAERQRLVRHLYELIQGLDDEIPDEKGKTVGEERFIRGLMPLIDAEAHLAHMTWDIQMGLSGLFEHRRRDWRTGSVYPD